MAPFFRKVLFVGLFAFLVNNWASLSTVIVRSGAQLGLNAGGGAMSMADLHNPGRVGQIGVELFGRTALAEGMNIFTDAIPMATHLHRRSVCGAGLLRAGAAALRFADRLQARQPGGVRRALPWGVFNGTAWVAERPLGWVAGCAIRLFVLALVASVSVTFVNTLPATLSLDAGGALNVLLFGLTVLALAWFGPQLASEVVRASRISSGNDAYPRRRRRRGHHRRRRRCGLLRDQNHGRRGARAWRRGGAHGRRRVNAWVGRRRRRQWRPRAPINYSAMQPRPAPPSKASSGGNP
jgi:type IV secretion system protein TrbL